MRLYGGAQYNRALAGKYLQLFLFLSSFFKETSDFLIRIVNPIDATSVSAEFRKVMGSIKCPHVNRELIANATGVNEMHDGADVVRTACIIAVAKAKEIFQPFLFQLGYRLSHILRKAPSIIMHMLRKSGSFLSGMLHFFGTI